MDPSTATEQLQALARHQTGVDLAAVGLLLTQLDPQAGGALLKRRGGFNPLQPRDPRGRWSLGGGGSHAHPSDHHHGDDDEDDDVHGFAGRSYPAGPSLGDQLARATLMTAVPAFAGAAASVLGGRLAQSGVTAVATRIAARGLAAAAGA